MTLLLLEPLFADPELLAYGQVETSTGEPVAAFAFVVGLIVVDLLALAVAAWAMHRWYQNRLLSL